MTPIEMLDQLAEYQAQLDVLRFREEETIASLIPQEIKDQIEAAKAEFALQRSGCEANIAELKEQVTEQVKQLGSTVKGNRLRAQFNKGRVTWDSKAIEGYAVGHPELFAFKKEGEAYVSFVNF